MQQKTQNEVPLSVTYLSDLVSEHSINQENEIQTNVYSIVEVDEKKLESDKDEEIEVVNNEEKGFWIILLDNICSIYGSVIMSIGIVLYLADMLYPTFFTKIFSICLVCLGLAWIIFLNIDVKFFLKGKHLLPKLKRSGKEKKKNTNDNMRRKRNKNDYMRYTQHTPGLYLKIGATVFAVGYIINLTLFLADGISLSLKAEDTLCADTSESILYALLIIYVFAQLYTLYEYSNIVISCHQGLAQLALTHIKVTSICFWVLTILTEIKYSMREYRTKQLPTKTPVTSADFSFFASSGSNESSAGEMWQLIDEERSEYYDQCIVHREGGFLILALPYLYPFGTEFFFLMKGVWTMLKIHIGHPASDYSVHQESFTRRASTKRESLYEREHQFTKHGTHYFRFNCQNSLQGLLGGGAVFIYIIIMLIIMISYSNKETMEQAINMNDIAVISLLAVMIVTVAVAFYQTQSLNLTKESINVYHVADTFVSLTAIVLFTILSTVAGVMQEEKLLVAKNILQLIQVCMQIAFIVDGLHRCSNTEKLQQRKPGRNTIMFLIICNQSFWLLETMNMRVDSADNRLHDFYGDTLWIVLSRFLLPFMLFFRFHSSVALVEIWMNGYDIDKSD